MPNFYKKSKTTIKKFLLLLRCSCIKKGKIQSAIVYKPALYNNPPLCTFFPSIRYVFFKPGPRRSTWNHHQNT